MEETSASTKNEPLLFDVEAARAKLGISRNALYLLFSEGLLKKSKIGSRTYVTNAEIERLASVI